MLAASLFILFGVSLAYVLYRLIRKLFSVLLGVNRKVEDMAHRAEVAVEAFRFASEDPDAIKNS